MLAESPSADEGSYLLEQRFRYTYATPVRRLRHRLVVVPRAVHGDQVLLDHRLAVSGSPAVVSLTTDEFANHVVEVRATGVAAWIEFETWAVVGWRDRGPSGVTAVPADCLVDARHLRPTPLTVADEALNDAAHSLSSSGGRGLDLAERICTWTHQALTYEYGVTAVHTTAAQALAGGRGVCQDYAHVMLAVCRAAGLACRYVSGHLAGEGGSHAWVEVMSAEAGGAVAVAFDPTHDRRAGRGYVTVAVGCDYADVPPTSGTFVGSDPGALTASKRLTLVPAPS